MVNIGSAKAYCNEDFSKIENYTKAIEDTNQVWELHHRLETHFSDGTERPKNAYLSYKELKALDMYWHRPAEELIFLTLAEHNSLHHKGKTISAKVKMKMGAANRGKKFSEEHKRKIGEAHKGMHFSDESKQKMSAANKSKHWYTNGVKNVYRFECPPGFVPGLTRRKSK